MHRDRNRLLQHFEEQVNFLISSCQEFDRGNESEAVRIASVLRTIFHNTTRSHSLLAQLGWSENLFLNSCDPYHPIIVERDGRQVSLRSVFPGPIAISATNQGWKYLPLLACQRYSPGYIPYSDWWKSIILQDDSSQGYSREELVSVLANREGGAHIDPRLNAKYESMRSSAFAWDARGGGVEGFINSPTQVAMRQIAWEVLESFRTQAESSAI